MTKKNTAKPIANARYSPMLNMPAGGWVMWLCHLSLFWATIVLIVATKWALFGAGPFGPGAFAFGLLCALLVTPMAAIGLFILSRYRAWANLAEYTWSRVEGTVIKSEYSYVRGTFLTFRNGIDVQVAFTIDKGTYIASQLRFGAVAAEEYRDTLEFFHVGRKVCVHYDPDDPTRNCLQTFRTDWEVNSLVVMYYWAVMPGVLISLG